MTEREIWGLIYVLSLVLPFAGVYLWEWWFSAPPVHPPAEALPEKPKVEQSYSLSDFDQWWEELNAKFDIEWRQIEQSLQIPDEHPIRRIRRRQRKEDTYQERRRLRMLANGGRHTRMEWRMLCQAFGMCCAKCGQRKPLTKDHIVPVSEGGSDDISNLQPLCRKGVRTIDYRKGRGILC